MWPHKQKNMQLAPSPVAVFHTIVAHRLVRCALRRLRKATASCAEHTTITSSATQVLTYRSNEFAILSYVLTVPCKLLLACQARPKCDFFETFEVCLQRHSLTRLTRLASSYSFCASSNSSSSLSFHSSMACNPQSSCWKTANSLQIWSNSACLVFVSCSPSSCLIYLRLCLLLLLSCGWELCGGMKEGKPCTKGQLKG